MELAPRHANVDAHFLDGCAVLKVMSLPTRETIQNFPQLLPSLQSTILNPVMYTLCSTDTRNSVSRRQPEMTEIKEPTKCIIRVHWSNFLLA